MMAIWNTTLAQKWPDPRDYPPKENPFERDVHGRIKSPAAIAKTIRENEAQARGMCRSAGESLAAWFPDNPR